MERFLRVAGLQIGRRRFLRATAATIFGLMAGIATGRTSVLATACCTAPYGGGQCDPACCNGYCYGYYCGKIDSCNPGVSACWTSDFCGCTCCDYYCTNIANSFYCWCCH